MAELLEQLRSGTLDWTDPRISSLFSWLGAGQRRFELQELLRDAASNIHTLTAAHARQLIDLLIELELIDRAYAVSALPQLAADPEIAAQRAQLAMRRRDYASAIAASEVAIAALLQPGLSIDECLRLCVAGAPAEGMLRFERHVLAERKHLSERLALRWEALHRAGLSRDASLMQLMCQRYFPDRASVWSTAGNHALDAGDLSSAENYFQRCLKLDASWTAALAGLAIVHERRKNWAAALPYRRRVLEVENALARDDAASLQRRLRYAAALARLGHWEQAEPLFRSAARSPMLAQLPAEKPVLLRVFSQELYAPAIVVALSHTTEPEHQHHQDPPPAPHRYENASQAPEKLALQTQPERTPPVASICDAQVQREADKPYDQPVPQRTEAGSAQQTASFHTAPARSHEISAQQTPTRAPQVALLEAPTPSRATTAKQPPTRLDQQEVGLCREAGLSHSAAEKAQQEAALWGARHAPALALARHEAALLERLRLRLMAAAITPSEQRLALAFCAYLSGELERAFELFDQVELDRPDDLAVHYLLWRCASALAHEQAASIRVFAEDAARARWAERERSAPLVAELGYALAILPSLAPEVRAAGYVLPFDELEELELIEAPLLVQLAQLTAFRAVHQAVGHSPLAAAAASTEALTTLAASR
jgi:hypothetical protein